MNTEVESCTKQIKHSLDPLIVIETQAVLIMITNNAKQDAKCYILTYNELYNL
jgi:hypothetical protein